MVRWPGPGYGMVGWPGPGYGMVWWPGPGMLHHVSQPGRMIQFIYSEASEQGCHGLLSAGMMESI